MQKGISRRIDELGRIVIPIEIRKSLKIRQSDELDITIDGEKIILNKTNSINKDKVIDDYILILGKYLNKSVFFTSKDQILSYFCVEKKKINNLKLDNEIIEIIFKRKKELYQNSNNNYLSNYNIIEPIVINGDLVGSIILSSDQIITSDILEIIEFTKIFFENYLEYE